MTFDPRLKHRLKILVCDDDRSLRQLIRTVFLMEFGFNNVKDAGDGKEAWDMVEAASKTKDPFHLIILDQKMPGMTGLEMLTQIRSHEATKSLAVMMLTGAADPSLEKQAEALQVASFVNKPVSRDLFGAKMLSVADTAVIPKTSGHVLIIDDDADIRRMVKQDFLGENGFHHVSDASNAASAIAEIIRHHGRPGQVDLVLCDFRMEGGTGLDVLKRLRADKRWTNLPFIMVTGDANKETVVACLKAGTTDYIVKPINPAELISKVKKHMPGTDVKSTANELDDLLAKI